MELVVRDNTVNTMEGDNLRFRLYKILHGPVQQAFVYVFHQTYAQTINVYEFSLEHPECFTEGELLTLQNEKKVHHQNLPLLFTIIKSTCNPPLAPPTDAVWRCSKSIKLETGEFSVEHLLASFLMFYDEAANISRPLTEEEFSDNVSIIKKWLKHLIEGTGKFDGSGRWKEELERLVGLITDIELKEVFPTDVIADDIKTELHMSYHLFDPRGVNPLLLKLVLVPEIQPQVKQNKDSKDHEVLYPVADLVKTFPLEGDRDPKRIVLIKGEPGCGRSNITALLGSSWSKKDNLITNVSDYDAVITVSGLFIAIQEQGLVKSFLPLCTMIHGEDEVRNWLLKSHVLLVMDDAEELTAHQVDELQNLIQESRAIDMVILTSPKSFDSLQKKCSNNIRIKLSLFGLGREEIIESSERIMCGIKNSDCSSLKTFLSNNICRLEVVLRHPVFLVETCKAWADKQDIFEDVTTNTDLLWTLTKWKIDKALQEAVEFADISRTKDWLLIAGLKALQAIKDDHRLEKTYMAELEVESSKVFVSMPSKNVMSLLFKKRYIQRSTFQNDLSVLHKHQQEFLAAWYVAHQVINGKRLNVILEDTRCPYHMAVFMIGLLSKIIIFKWLSGMHERRLISTVVNYAEGSNEDLDFNLDIVTEVKGLLKNVEVIVDFSEYPDEWNVDAGDIQVIPLEALLSQVAPTRIFLNVEELKPYSELEKAINFLRRVDIFAWLDSSCQFQYGNRTKMDSIVKLFFSLRTRTRIDLIKGQLSSKVLKEMTSQAAFSYLVFMKLRVTDLKNLLTVVKIPKSLPKLLWLEIKFDFPVLDEDVCSLPKITVPLLDVYLQGLDDTCVSKLANLLGSLHDSYAGIHLENTSFTPEGVFVLLKQLQKRNVYLYAPPKHREQFRRWYYPQLSNFDKNIELTDELAVKILGFDDRIYYSNHSVESSCFALALDSWNLSSYLEEEENIVQFTYSTDNLTCIKNLQGTVSVMVNGKRQVRKKQTDPDNS